MKKTTDFAKYLTSFLTDYLRTQKNASKNTIASYRDTFKLLLKYCADYENIPAQKFKLVNLTPNLVINFLNWLEDSRNCGTSTRNQRLTAINAFCHYVQYENPELILPIQKISNIPTKKVKKQTIAHLTPKQMEVYLSQADKTTNKGRRDLTLLSLLYDSAIRVQELIDLKASDVILEYPYTIVVTGKGNKQRKVPITENVRNLLDFYIKENRLNDPRRSDNPLFVNNQKSELTRAGITYIIKKYIDSARNLMPSIPNKITPHMFRHSRAMHLLEAGVNLIYIRDFLGHSNIETTERYARANVKMKYEAINKVKIDILGDSDIPSWNEQADLIDFLENL